MKPHTKILLGLALMGVGVALAFYGDNHPEHVGTFFGMSTLLVMVGSICVLRGTD